ncbi:hypothetical protein R1sor_022512 [Riccia sorocarpa]|uniref:Phosphate transporter PHO1 n=1 Tax=Riccia sorocarpa TaxID=122646 RepID=A0ABD3GNX0_9MARC
MVKFGKELEAQLVQEWRSAYVDYKQLKRKIAAVKEAVADSPSVKHPGSKNFTRQITRKVSKVQDSFVTATGRAADFLRSRPISRRLRQNEELLKVERIDPTEEGKYEEYTTELSDVLRGSLGFKIGLFFAQLDGEFNKVNHFCMNKEKEFVSQFETLRQQVEALEDIRVILKQGGSYHPAAATESDSGRSNTISEAVERATERLASRQDLKIEMNELGPAREKSDHDSSSRGGGSNKPHMRLQIPVDTPRTAIKSVTQSLWEDLLKLGGPENFSSGGEAGFTVTKKNVRAAEKMLKDAFQELYRGLGLLKSYCSLNGIAFWKILKKFDKASGYRTLDIYIKAVELSHFSTSKTTITLLENLEELYAKTFTKDDHSKARNQLRLVKKKASHKVTFFLGLFTGGSVAFLTIFAVLLNANRDHYIRPNSAPAPPGQPQQPDSYLRTIFPVFSISALIILHMFMYGFNVYFWSKWRINFAFMFDMRQGTELRHPEILMVASVLLTILMAVLVGQLTLHGVSDSPYVDLIPLSVFMLMVVVLLFPFNMFKRSSRIFFITTFIHLSLAPFYKVLLKDFFLGDQLTSQVPMLRDLVFTLCYYTGGFFKQRDADRCVTNETYRAFIMIVSLIPYWWRFLQCLRRYFEEHDPLQMQNAGKYLITAIAVALRIQYMRYRNLILFVLHIVASVIATIFQTYWDLCVDWGLLHKRSKNKWLRDSLIMPKAKFWYFLSIIVNVILRLAWAQSITRFRFGLPDIQVADFTFACLEVIRRGIWNFYRMENEHLNNVGKYRATKTVPLPFVRLEDE